MRAGVVVVLALVGCASPAPVHRVHLGATLDTPRTELAEPAQGRTDDDRTRAQALLVDGAKLRDAGDLAGSAKALEEALQLDASLARAHVEWALTAEGLGVEPELINAHYQLGARLAPDDPRAQTLAAAWAVRQGDPQRALEGYDRALAADPRNIEALCRKADLLAQRGDHAAAMSTYQRALDVDPGTIPAIMGAATEAEKAGALDVAEKRLRDLIAMFPEVPLYRQRLIEFLRRSGQSAKATAAQKELDKEAPKDNRHLRTLKR